MKNGILISESDHTQFNKQKSLLKGKGFSYVEVLRSTLILFIYLLIGITGMAGSVFIIIKVINLTSISIITMVLLFVIEGISLAAIRSGFYGFYEVIKESD
jgi:hypothetical protein